MTAPNHALTGVLIGLAVSNPWLALPLALVSHFICDALPHYAASKPLIGIKRFKVQLIIEALVCGLIVLALGLLHPLNWMIAAIAAFLATSPDFMWIQKFLRAQSGKQQLLPKSAIIRFHARIQWFERPIGGVFEVAWAVAMVVFISPFVR